MWNKFCAAGYEQICRAAVGADQIGTAFSGCILNRFDLSVDVLRRSCQFVVQMRLGSMFACFSMVTWKVCAIC